MITDPRERGMLCYALHARADVTCILRCVLHVCFALGDMYFELWKGLESALPNVTLYSFFYGFEFYIFDASSKNCMRF